MRKRHTDVDNTKGHHPPVLYFAYHGTEYGIPRKIADQYILKKKSTKKVGNDTVAAGDLFVELDKQYTKSGVLLRGVRIREGLTQVEFAKKINITQANLSSMENGKRTIGKDIAKRIAKLFDVDYRYFL